MKNGLIPCIPMYSRHKITEKWQFFLPMGDSEESVEYLIISLFSLLHDSIRKGQMSTHF